MSFPRYERYKDSGVDWLGEIPQHWSLRKAKWIYKQVKRPPRKEDDVVTCFRDGEVTLRKNRRIEGFTNALQEHGYQGIRKGDLVIHAMDAFSGAIGVSDSDGKSTPVYSVCLPRKENEANSYFYAYLLRYIALSGFIQSLAKGIRERSTDFRYKDFAELVLPLPEPEEQKRIAEFLDRKCSEIDEAIAKKQRLIELLDEQKTILINQAVTKGLDPDVPMKDSGIDWLGEIPKYWEVKKLKRLFKEVDKRSKDGREELLSLRMYEGLVFHNNVSDKRFKPSELIGYKCIEKGQIVMNRMRAAIGLFGLCEIPGLVSPDYATFDAKEDIKQEYYLHLFKTKALKDQFRLDSKGLGTGSSGFLRLYSDKFGMIKVPFPTKEEQSKIVEYLQKVSIRFSEAILKVREDLSKLEELKKVLIAEAVTGKIKI